MLTVALPLGSANVELDMVVNELSLLIDSPVMLLDAPYMKATGVAPLAPPPPPDLPWLLGGAFESPQELANTCSRTIANRRPNLLTDNPSMNSLSLRDIPTLVG